MKAFFQDRFPCLLLRGFSQLRVLQWVEELKQYEVEMLFIKWRLRKRSICRGKILVWMFLFCRTFSSKRKEHTNTTGMNSDVSGPKFRCVFFFTYVVVVSFTPPLFNSLLIFREKQSQSMHRQVRTRAVGPNMLQAVER